MPKLPDQKNPLAAQQRIMSCGSNPYIRRNRHIWMHTPRWALRMPFGLLVDPDEKNSTAASLGHYRRGAGLDQFARLVGAARDERLPRLAE